MRSPGFALFALVAVGMGSAACGAGTDDRLSSECVDKIFPKPHTVSAGGSCSTFFVQGGACDACAQNSTCQAGLACAFSTCQRSECTSDADCGGGTCQALEVVVGSRTCSYGRYCKKGTVCKAHTTCDGTLCCEYTCVNGQSKQGRCW